MSSALCRPLDKVFVSSGARQKKVIVTTTSDGDGNFAEHT
jgi:hypothetical protein